MRLDGSLTEFTTASFINFKFISPANQRAEQEQRSAGRDAGRSVDFNQGLTGLKHPQSLPR